MERRNDPRQIWSSIKTLLGQNPTSATTDISGNDFVTFFGRKTPDVRKESQEAKPPNCAPLHSLNFIDFAQLTVDNVKNRIIDKPAKQSDLVPGTTWLINECASDISPYIVRLFNISLASGCSPSFPFPFPFPLINSAMEPLFRQAKWKSRVLSR